MTAFARIHADLEYNGRRREDVDITDILLEVLADDQMVEEFAASPNDDDAFGNEYQWQLSIDDREDGNDLSPYTPVEGFSLEEALAAATGGTIVGGLLPMWRAWKAFMESPEEVARQQRATAEAYAEKVADHVRGHSDAQRDALTLAVLARLLAQPGAIEMIPDAITQSGIPAIDAMKALRDLTQ